MNWLIPTQRIDVTRPPNLKVGVANNTLHFTNSVTGINSRKYLSLLNTLQLTQNIHLKNPKISVGNTLNLTQQQERIKFGEVINYFHYLQHAEHYKHNTPNSQFNITQNIIPIRGFKNQFALQQTADFKISSGQVLEDKFRIKGYVSVYKANNPNFVLTIDEL